MFTPQPKRFWPGGVGDAPRTEPHPGKTRYGSNSAFGFKEKSVAALEPSFPVTNGAIHASGDALDKRVSELEQELLDYQYNMGLLLIDKKEWTVKYEELERLHEEAKEALKREQAAHLIAMADVEIREDNLRKALGVEKQCVHDLEIAVRELRSEIAEIKFTADSKLAEANALVSGVEEKSLEVESKLHAIDAKLAEISRKSSEVERKTQEVELQESNLRRERLSFITEKEAQISMLEKQREDLREWEKKLRDSEERIAKSQQIIIQREERAAENDKMRKQKEKEFKDTQKKIEEANAVMKSKEEDICKRLASLKKKESEFEEGSKKLITKEEELQAFEISVKEREQVFVQRLTEEHNLILEAKRHDLELEMEQKRLCLENELKCKINEIDKKEVEVKIMEENLAKKEKTLDIRLKNFKEKEKEFEVKLKDVKLREKNVKSDEKAIRIELEKIHSEKEELVKQKNDLQETMDANQELLQKIVVEEKTLQVSEKERHEYIQKQADLKGEIEKCRAQQDLLLKEADDLKRQRENFEKEWEELDDKKEEINREVKVLREQQSDADKVRLVEEGRLKEERKKIEDYVKREMEALQDMKESFEAEMAHERSVLAEKAHVDRSHMLQEIEQLRIQEMNELEKKKEQLEMVLIQKERVFEEEKEKELKNLNVLNDVARKEREDIEEERRKLERERSEIDENQKHLQDQQREIQVDITNLDELSRKLKRHREEFVKEKERFLEFVGQHKSCTHCSDITSEYVLSDLISSREIDKANISLSPRLEIKLGQPNEIPLDPSGNPANEDSNLVRTISPVSWIKKCTSKIFKFSPGKKSDELRFEEPSKINGAEQSNVERLVSEASTRDENDEVSESINDEPNRVSEVDHPRRGRRVTRTRKTKAKQGNDEKVVDELAKQVNDGEKKKKRDRTTASMDEPNGNESDKSNNVAVANNKKRRQKAAAARPLVEPRYYLRRPKLAVGVTNSKTSVEVPVASSRNAGTAHLIPCKKSNEKSVDDGEVNQEVYGSAEPDGSSPSRSEAGAGDGDYQDEEDSEHQAGQASIGKKLWTFFTT